MIATRRGLITGLTSLIVAPAIVRASSLMPISVQVPPMMLHNRWGSFAYVGSCPLESGRDIWRCISSGPEWSPIVAPAGLYSMASSAYLNDFALELRKC